MLAVLLSVSSGSPPKEALVIFFEDRRGCQVDRIRALLYLGASRSDQTACGL